MQHHGDLAFKQAKSSCDIRIENGIHNTDLKEMIPGAKGSQLFFAPVHRPFADLRRVRIGQASAVLGMRKVGRFTKAMADRPLAAGFKDLFFIGCGQLYRTGGSDPAGNVLVQGVYQRLELGTDLGFRKGCSGQADPAVDVISDASRGDDTGFPVKGGNPADGKSVSPVHVRHGQGCPDDSRKGGHIGHLRKGFLAVSGCKKRFAGIHPARNPHIPGSGDFPPVVVNFFKCDRHGCPYC